MAAMTAFRAEKCCHLVSENERLPRSFAAAYASS